MLADLAEHAGQAVHAVRLTSDLQRARERIVAAREEERRTLRRDLHDGIGPTLAGITLQVDLARTAWAWTTLRRSPWSRSCGPRRSRPSRTSAA